MYDLSIVSEGHNISFVSLFMFFHFFHRCFFGIVMFFLIFVPATFAGSVNFSPYQIPDSLLSVYQTRKNLLSQTIHAPAFHFSYSLLSILFD